MPFQDRISFDFANYHFVKVQSSKAKIDVALDMWAASVLNAGGPVSSMPEEALATFHGPKLKIYMQQLMLFNLVTVPGRCSQYVTKAPFLRKIHQNG